ncbi:hypothetical protein B0A48_04103 [Cryoendolithus antarcticus]|uniref:CID domain-containing protein n=1 Tax=Cryoendolithus antarcticus TaxID=1507870 RepID=A0A1V8THE0_9PEZI|nr:hypothetical protein B0A48_04103 [Cryoendolithus antarcticus]
MEIEEDLKEFPDVTSKLAAPKKISAFEREKQAAEAKRLRAEEENAAALREFEESFGHDDEDGSRSNASAPRAPPTGPRGGGMGGGMGSGRLAGGSMRAPVRNDMDSLGGFAGQAPPPSLKRKRALEEARELEEARREQGVFGAAPADFDDTDSLRPTDVVPDYQEDTAPKPTMQLGSVLPGTSVEELKALLSPYVSVHSVRWTPPAQGGAPGRNSLTAIATLVSSTSAGQIDTAVSALRDKYIGCGFYLSASRHLSSAAQYPGLGGAGGARLLEPFGAISTRERNSKSSMKNAPPPREHRGGFAPPEYYDRQAPVAKAAGARVEVHPPLDIATVRAVHTVSDRILSESDPDRAVELEALLMSMPEVQKDEHFAFLYDSTSTAGIYYRYCLWGPEDADELRGGRKDPVRIFGDLDMEWLPPHKEVPFPDLTSLAQVTEHIDYDSSDEESDDDGDDRRTNGGIDGDSGPQKPDKTRLTPLQRARFTHLLARLPTSIARLRQGDIARISNYVITHAGSGADELVDLLLLNIEKPFSTLRAAKDPGSDSSPASDNEGEDDYEPGDALPILSSTSTPPSGTDQRSRPTDIDDPSNPKLIALYAVSDILAASSTAGARNAWKFRSLFEAGFKACKTFERLGRLDKELGWGKMKAEQWKRKVGVVFGCWEGWNVFSGDVHAELKKAFFEPPLTEEEKRRLEAEEARKKSEGEGKWMSKFKKLGEGSASPIVLPAVETSTDDVDMDVDGEPMADLDGEVMKDMNQDADDDVDGQPMDDVDGAPMEETIAAPTPPAPLRGGMSFTTSTRGGRGGAAIAATKKPGRMKAEDMFGESESD